MKRLSALMPFLLAAATAVAQDKPYFQQFVKYNIQVSLDDVKHELNANETLEYTNNSPDELPFIWMHLWPNAYKENGTALEKQLTENGETFLHYAKAEDRGYIDQLDFKVDGQPVKTEADPEHIDIVKLLLSQPLKPGQTITITTPFHVKVPSGKISRMGHLGQQYQITQWYPKPAVYDRNGWNPIPYLDQGEFYSEFGTYDVSITLPKNYVVGATGDLVDGEAETSWLNDKVEATKKKYAEARKKYTAAETPASDAATKTLHYHQEKVHDFAWFCDKTYNVLKGKVTLPNTGHKVTTWVMFTDKYAGAWKDAIPYVNDALYYYSKWNGDYPYNQCTAVDGALSAGGGMEYPNITVIGATDKPYMLEVVIMHEVGHNWFYGLLGSNERIHGWMDEGINSYNELRYQETKYPNKALLGDTSGPSKAAHLIDLDRYKQKAQYYQLYCFAARQNLDQSLAIKAPEYTTINYAAMMYYKTAIAFDYMRGYLGDELMDKCMHTYFDRWEYKHPMPEDIRKVFEEVTGKNLAWFFDDVLGSTKKLDYRIGGTHKQADGSWEVNVKNTGNIAGPVALCGVKDGLLRGIVWYDGFTGSQKLTFPAADLDYFVLDYNEDMPQINRKNDRAYTHGLLKHAEPFRLQLLGSLDNPERTQLFWTPAFGWNYYNGFMLGAAVYNQAVPMKHFEWMLMPMFGFRNQDVAGHAHAFFHFTPDKVFQQIDIGANYTRYDYLNEPLNDLNFNKVAPEINLAFKKKRMRSPIEQNLRLRSVMLLNDEVSPNFEHVPVSFDYAKSTRTFYEATYSIRNKRKINPWDVSVMLQQGDSMMKAQLTANYHVNYNAKKGLDIRVFGGTFFDNTNAGPYRFRMSGWRGYNDYLYDHIYMGRSETRGLGANEMAVEDGGFKLYTPLGQSSMWLASMNLETDIPVDAKFINSLRLFADVGTCEWDGINTQRFMYDAGVKIRLFKSFADIYIPLLMSKDLKDAVEANDWSFLETIRFSLRLERFNPTKLAKTISF